MGYSPEEIRELEAKIDAALNSGRLNVWETKFLRDIGDRVERFGVDIRLSERQASKLLEILDGGTSPLRPQLSTRRPPSYRSWQHRPRRALSREVRWWSRRFVRDFALVAALVLGAVVYAFIQEKSFPNVGVSGFSSGSIVEDHFAVIDGDTIRFHGEAKGTRLVGYNAPETSGARCSKERELGNRATDRLRELVATADLTFEKVKCACQPGTEGTEACNYGRACGVLRADGRDVGQVLISEGLAVPFVCGSTSCPPTPRPWCKIVQGQ